jgi:hypothetical protein
LVEAQHLQHVFVETAAAKGIVFVELSGLVEEVFPPQTR